MALVGPGALTEYTGGPRQSRRRGFVTVSEPANGFFIAGSSIDAMNGVYGRVRPQSIWSAHSILLAYRNDNNPHWIMALVEAKPKGFGTRTSRARYSEHSDDSDEDYIEEKREWLFIDAECRDRFVHDGDTIIPGAGVNWKHVHRASVKPKKKPAYAGSDDSDTDNEYASDSDDDPISCTALQEQAPDDEDELPWQIVAILDHQTMRDMRYTQRCYDQDIRDAITGKHLPKPVLTDIDNLGSSGRWLFKVTAPRGVEVRASPESGAPTVGWREHGEYLQGVELRGNWLRLPSPVEKNDEEFYDPYEDALEMWVQVTDAQDVARLTRVAEEDVPNMDSNLPDDPQADIFDRPFEPMLEDANAKEEEDPIEEETSGKEEVCHHDSSDAALVSLPSLEIAHELGTEVMLEGLTKDDFNGQHATVVTRPTEDCRQGVRLTASGQKISVKVINLRPILSSETGPLARHARVLGLTLHALGLQKETQESSNDDGLPLSANAAEELLGAALRAAQRDTQHEAQGAHRDLQAAYDELKSALSERAGVPEDASVKTPANAKPRAPHECVEQGALGTRAAKAAKLAGDIESIERVQEGVDMLRQLLLDEQSRIHCARKNANDTASSLAEESGDTLRLRLTLVRALLRCRRESEASSEAAVARRSHPSSSAAALWHGRCLLRAGKREESLKSFNAAATVSEGPDGAWANMDSKMRLKASQLMERHEQRAKTAYGRGMFEEAAQHYGEAISNADIVADDKWSRAELHANRAACYRRARAFKAAIGDLDIALSLFPRYKRAHFRRGVCLLEAGNPKDAVTSLETLMGLDREWPNLLDWIVRAHALDRRQRSGKYRPGDIYGQWMPEFASSGGWAEAPEENDIASEKNHYTVLGVPADATEKQLKKAYRIMSLKFHPDKEGGSTRAFQRIATAYQTLSDPEKRQLYDEGADLKKGDGGSDSDSDEEREHRSLREEIERKYFPERYKFWPFGDPFVQKRKRQEKQRQRAGKPAWYEDEI